MQDTTEPSALYPDPIPTPQAVAPFSHEELRLALRSPIAAIDVLLAQRARWTLTLTERAHWKDMVLILLIWTVLFSLPYGLVLSSTQLWKVAVLFLGSVALCFPSLHVVSAYLGVRAPIAQTFALAGVVAAVASAFSCSFAPILWFLQATSDQTPGDSTVAGLSSMLLGLAALAGAAHGMRCLQLTQRDDMGGTFALVMLTWECLLLFIGVRMGNALGLM